MLSSKKVPSLTKHSSTFRWIQQREVGPRPAFPLFCCPSHRPTDQSAYTLLPGSTWPRFLANRYSALLHLAAPAGTSNASKAAIFTIHCPKWLLNSSLASATRVRNTQPEAAQLSLLAHCEPLCFRANCGIGPILQGALTSCSTVCRPGSEGEAMASNHFLF